MNNYPPGADQDPNAPWKEVEKPSIQADVLCSQTLSKSYEVTTTDYELDYDDTDRVIDMNTLNTDWNAALSENGILTPVELLEECKQILRDFCEALPSLPLTQKEINSKQRYYGYLIKQLSDWTTDETIVMKD